MALRQICVFCGSSLGARPEYAEAAETLGEILVSREIDLVYGGARVGLMGLVANAVLEHGGKVTGVIPRALTLKEVAHEGLTELHQVESMHERKSMMADLSDGFIALPGGPGTFEETFEIWTWVQLGLLQKPIGILNVDGFYDRLGDFLDHAVQEQFLREQHRSMLLMDDDPGALLDAMEAFDPPEIVKWIEKGEE